MEMENNFQALVEKMKEEMFSSSIDLGSFVSLSAYDTAWLAMIPDPQSPARPMFPQCLDWLLNNQRELGFWGHPNHLDQPSIRECITTTLACIVSLKSWDVGYETINKGLEFIHENTEKLLIEVEGDSPRWFAIVFPGMVEHAWSRGVDIFPDGSPQIVKSLFNERQQIFEMKEALDHPFCRPLLYYYEALPSTYKVDCMEEVLRHLTQCGSLFQSPSATARAFMDTNNKKSQDYLESLVQRFRTGVPPVYPVDEELIKLCMVDRVERLGLDEHFHQEINNVLCDVYSNWQGRDVQVIEDYSSSLQIYKNSLAYRLLTLHGYRVSPSLKVRMTEKMLKYKVWAHYELLWTSSPIIEPIKKSL